LSEFEQFAAELLTI